MCGIAGFCNLKKDPQKNIERMLNQIIHRGPDASGIWMDPCDTGLTFGHRRLSILDLSENGSQPMISHSRRYVICYNGEIYNHRYLLKELVESGYKDAMHGTSDTEILLEAIDFFGPTEAIKKCKGMFAIALYDREEETLSLYRDRIGEKPLYYGICGGAFVFASELGAIKAIEGFDNEINADVCSVYMTHGYIPAPYSIYKNVYKLEPGTSIKIKCRVNKNATGNLEDYNPKFDTFWSLTEVATRGQKHLFSGSREDAAEELERLLIDSIRDQMISDVPLGAFLSAGIDSTTVVSLMQSISDRPVKSFTIGFDDPTYNEATAAAEIAKYLGTEHTELYVTKQDALDVIPKLSNMFGEPFADSSQIPTYLVSRMTREHVTVSLSGDGGDELFGGYRSYAGIERIWNKIGRIPQFVRTPAGAIMKKAPIPGTRGRAVKLHGTLIQAHNPAQLYRLTYETDPLIAQLSLYGKNLPYKYTEMDEHLMDDPYHAAMLMDMKMYHVDDILVKVDRAAMAVSLESRVPMLDKDVVEFAWTLPVEFLRKDGIGKQVLRDVLYKHVPKELVDLPKKGFSVPVKEWLLEDELRSWAEELLNPDSIKNVGLLDENAVNTLWSDYSERGIWRPQVWYALMLQNFMMSNLTDNITGIM